MEIIDEETGFNDKNIWNAIKESKAFKNTWKTRYFNDTLRKDTKRFRKKNRA